MTPKNRQFPIGSLKGFHQIMENDLGNPALGAGVRKRQFRPAPPNSRLPLRMATVASKYLNICLEQTCRLKRLRPMRARSDLAEALSGMDLVLIEVNWEYENRNWAPQMRNVDAANAANGPLELLLSTCRELGIPTAMWITADRTSQEVFAHLHGRCDATFAGDPVLAKRLSEGGKPAHHLPPAIEPRLHNPLFRDQEGAQYVRRNFGLASDSYNELCGFDSESPVPGLLEPALDYLFWIFETRFAMRNNNARLGKNYRRRFLGCFEDLDRATILKNSQYYLSAVPRPEIAQPDKARNLLEAMAAKSVSITNMEPFLDAVEPFLRRVGSADEVRATLAEFTENPHLHRILTHLAYREVMQNHTYADRLRSIADHLRLPPGKVAAKGDPLITAMVPTMRPQLLPFVLDGYRRHNYKNLEMVIVLHSDSYSASDLAPMLREEDRARVIRVPESQSVGTALNVGIDEAQGDYWARIDDDDYYGPNYFNDAMLNRKFYDFDICGKSQWFIYFEALNGAFVHKKNWAAHSINPVIAGGTFLIRNSRDGRLRFDDRVRGYADVDLIGREIDRGECRIVSSDPFNFLQIRRMDRKSHTWTADMSQIARSEQITEGMNLSRIGI